MLTTSPTLLEKLREPSNLQAWTRFVELYTPLLLHWARRQGFHDADADDLVQEVFVKLLCGLQKYKRGAGQSFRGWLMTVCRNQCQDFRRRRATRAMAGAEGLSGLEQDSARSDIEEREYRRMLVQRILDLIRRDFSDETWDAFTDIMIKGRDAREVAAELGISVNAVYLARHRVLTRLRQEMDGLME